MFAGVCLGPKLKASQPVRMILALVNNAPLTKSITKANDSPIELYDYPTIKWRPKPFADPQGAIAQLWTSYDWADEQHQSGKMNYKLSVFQASDKHECFVQLLDDNGFKLAQIDVSDFRPVPGVPGLMEAKDSLPCTEAEYKRIGDYSVN